MNNKKLKGFTLVELIIVIGLMSVLMVMVGLILKPISQVFADTTAYTEDRYVMDGMAQYLDESLKYADKVLLVYDKDWLPIEGNEIEDYIAPLMDVNYDPDTDAAFSNSIQCIAIINDCTVNVGSAGLGQKYNIDHFTDNSGIQHTGRIYKSAYVDGERRTWLVGGEAFYGDGSYFINIEGDDSDSDGHIDSGDLRYTIYSIEPKQYKELSYADALSRVSTFRDKTRDEISSTDENLLIKNYSEKSVHFVNSPFKDDGKIGVRSPVDAGETITPIRGSNTINEPSPDDEYNIYIFYTVPGGN